jgi:site-specific DNA recombinase
MEGSHQKGSNWYRCQYVYERGVAAAEAVGRPKVLGVKEEVVLEAIREFMAERLFGPDRLRLLRKDLVTATCAEKADPGEAERDRLKAERQKIEAAMRRPALRLEEHDDPEHPVVKLAKERIEDLGAKAEAIGSGLEELECVEREGPTAAEIEAMLGKVPDLREAMKDAEGEDLVELLDAFDVTVSYYKPSRRLELSAAIESNLLADDKPTVPAGRAQSQGSDIAGAVPGVSR